MSVKWKRSDSKRNQKLLRSDSYDTPEKSLSKFLNEDYDSDALAFLSSAVDVILRDQSNIWVSILKNTKKILLKKQLPNKRYLLINRQIQKHF